MTRLGLNVPNLITLTRLMSVPLMIWLIVGERYGVAFWVFIVAGARYTAGVWRASGGDRGASPRTDRDADRDAADR